MEDAEQILSKLEEIYHTTGDMTLQPDVVSYTTLVTAWTNSHRKAYGAKRAEEIVKRMEAFATESGNTSVRPNTVTYNTVLNAWCRSGDSDAPTRSLEIFRTMQEGSYDVHINGNPINKDANGIILCSRCDTCYPCATCYSL